MCFQVGLETGSVLVGNRKGKTLKEKFSSPYHAFTCPITTLSRNPSYLKFFICVGGYEIKILAEDCKESYIFWSKYGINFSLQFTLLQFKMTLGHFRT